MKKAILSLVLVTFIFYLLIPISAQSTTVWGPGKNYEIAYIHSGRVDYDDTTLLEFNNLPVTDFTIKNLTNTGYSYIYRGYGNVSLLFVVELKTISIPSLGSFEFPTGGFPVVLPLSFNGKNDWMVSFAEAIKAVSGLLSDSEENQFFNAKVEIKSETVDFFIETALNSTSLDSLSNNNLPLIGIDLLNGSIDNGKLTNSISYTKSTGAMYSLDTQFISTNYTALGSENQVTVKIFQSLEFVAIIPPATFIEEAIKFDSLWLLSIFFIIPFRKRKKTRL